MDPVLASVIIFLALCLVAIVAVVFRDSEVAKAAVDALTNLRRKK